MDDLETRLRAYGREVLDTQPPVALAEVLDDLLLHRPGDTPVRSRGADHRRRRAPLAAAAALIAVTVGAIAVFGGDGRERPALSSEPEHTARPESTLAPIDTNETHDADDTAETNGPIDQVDTMGVTFTETSLGTLQWTVVERDAADLPLRIVGREDDGTLVGEGNDRTRMVSYDGGQTWSVEAGVPAATVAIGDLEWARLVDGADTLVRGDGSGESRITVVPSAIERPPAPWTMSVSTNPFLPVDVDGVAHVVAMTTVSLDVRSVLDDLGLENIDALTFDDGAAGIDVYFGEAAEDGVRVLTYPDTSAPAPYHLTERPGTRLLDLIDADGNIVTTIDANIAGFEDVTPLDLARGASRLVWLRHEDTRFVPADSPLPEVGTVGVVAVPGGALVVATTGPVDAPGESGLWRVDRDGWTALNLPDVSGSYDWTRDAPDPSSAPTLEEMSKGVVLSMPATNVSQRHFVIEDGRSPVEVHLPGRADAVERFTAGWIATSRQSPTVFWVNSGGDRWELFPLGSLIGLSNYDTYAGPLAVYDTTVYRSITNPTNGRRLLLIGELVTSPPIVTSE